MMQMLSAGGMPALSDGQRSADANNPRGYYEVESVKSLARDSRVIAQAEGKVVKVVSSLLEFLPEGHEYRVIFMRRPLEQVIASQDRMLERLGKQAPPAPRDAVMKAFAKHLQTVQAWLSARPDISVLYVDYETVLAEPHREASRISAFLERELDVGSMVRKIELSLHRERSTSQPVGTPLS